MKLDNKYLHEMVENFGVNHLIDKISPDNVDEHDIMVILRTIQTSKEILVERLTEYAIESATKPSTSPGISVQEIDNTETIDPPKLA